MDFKESSVNTLSTKTFRDKWRRANLDQLLRQALVAEAICEVDRSAVKVIHNPYGSQPTTTVQALAGTYSVSAFTTTDDDLTVADEFICPEHVFDFEDTLSNFDLFANRADEQGFSVALAIDKFVLNNLCEDGTGTYTTPVGGFTTAANVNVIMSNLLAKVAGYKEAYTGLFLVIENTDLPGILQAAATNGFSFADSALNNGYVDSYMGVDIYVVRSGTFADETKGTKTYTNAGHRVFGVKGKSTYAAPRGVKFDEKGVSGKTGKEVVTYGYIGVKTWAVISDLIIDITLD